MNINVTALLVLVAALLTHSAYAYFSMQVAPNPTDLPWVPIDVSKSRSFVNKTKDAGMFTEFSRRKAIIGSVQCLPSRSFWQKGFTNGVLESSLTGICPAIFKRSLPPIFGTGDGPVTINSSGEYDENTIIIDGSGAVINGGVQFVVDGGNAYTV